MTERRALFIQGDGSDPQHTAEETRLLMAALLGGQTYDAVAPGIGAIARGHGVIGAASLLVSPNGTPNDTVHVAVGAFAIRGTQENDQNTYVGGNDGQVTLNVSPSTTNPRNDLVVAQVRDGQYAAFTQDDWVLDIVEGTPAGSPVDPAVPEDALVLARLRVPTGVSAVISAAEIDDLRPRAVATGGITPVTTLAGLPSPGDGDLVWDTILRRLSARQGGAWHTLADAGGWTNYSPTFTNCVTSDGTTFGRYSKVGRVVTWRAGFTLGPLGNVTGLISVSLPVVPANVVLEPVQCWAGDVSGGLPRYGGTGVIRPADQVASRFADSNTSVGWDGSQPFNWEEGDQLLVGGQYEAAS